MNNLGHVFENFQSHAFSILSLSEQWRSLEGRFSMAEASISSHANELESKEREIGVVSRGVENLQKEVELKQRRVELAEKSVSQRVEAVEMSRSMFVSATKFWSWRRGRLVIIAGHCSLKKSKFMSVALRLK